MNSTPAIVFAMSIVSRQRRRREELALRMATEDHTIKIFVSSPGDVEEERLLSDRVRHEQQPSCSSARPDS
jgi:hypothetical protein